MIRDVCSDWKCTVRLDRALYRKKKQTLIDQFARCNFQFVTFHKMSNDFKLVHLKHMTGF